MKSTNKSIFEKNNKFSNICCILIILTILCTQNSMSENRGYNEMVYSLCNDVDTLWVGSFVGLIKYNKKTKEYIRYTKENSGLPSNSITGLAKDSKNNIWVACQTNGIGRFKNGFCNTTYNCKNSKMFSDQYLEGIHIDKNDTVFFGSNGSFNRLYDNQVKNINIGDGIESAPQNIADIAQAPNGDLLLATFFGLHKYSKGVITLLNNITARCNTLEADNNGNIYLGTVEGFYKYSNGILNRYDSINSERKGGVGSLAIDKNNGIWIANGRGFINFKENGGSISYFSSIMTSWGFKIISDENSIWIGTLNGELYRFDLTTKLFEKINIGLDATNLTNISSANQLKIYPNPANDIINISLPINLGTYKIEICDFTGKLKYESNTNTSSQINSTQNIDISNLSKGIYLIKLTSGDDVYSEKLVKN